MDKAASKYFSPSVHTTSGYNSSHGICTFQASRIVYDDPALSKRWGAGEVVWPLTKRAIRKDKKATTASCKYSSASFRPREGVSC